MAEECKVATTFKGFFVTFVSVLGLNFVVKYHLNNLLLLNIINII